MFAWSELFAQSTFKTGLESAFEKNFSMFEGKKLGLIVNQSSITRDSVHSVDLLFKKGVIAKLFAPEHGIRGDKDTINLSDGKDEKTGLPIISLYQLKKKEPSDEDVQGIDAFVFDIQEVGVRYYTYASTMVYCMKAAAKAGIPFYVLDRPNPAAPLGVYGPVLEKEFWGGFTSMYPIPLSHGMTIGELAQFYNSEFGINAKLIVIPMENYDRTKYYDELGVPWINPSPNIRSTNAAIGYHLFGSLEDMGWSVGRGTQSPFLTYGLPAASSTLSTNTLSLLNSLQARLRQYKLPGIGFSMTMFSPGSSKFQGKMCLGFSLQIIDRKAIQPTRTMLAIAREIYLSFPDSVRNKELDRAARSFGSRKVLQMIRSKKKIEEIENALKPDIDKFLAQRKKYLIYGEDASKPVNTPPAAPQKSDSQKPDNSGSKSNGKSDGKSGDHSSMDNSSELDFKRVRAVVQSAIKDGAFPAASVGIMKNGSVVFQESFGAMTYDPNAVKTPVDAVYDMASVTKVLCTTVCVMKLFDEGKLKLDDSVSRFIPEFAANGKGDIRIKNLLLHNSGLAAFRQYDQKYSSPEEAMKALFDEKLMYKTGDSMVYSDLGFITLGEVVKRIAGKPLDVYFADNIAKPLGLTSTGFNPDKSLLARITPTEKDTLWKQNFARPLVHDPRAALFRGVAGHAGLFSTTEDVMKLLKALLYPEAGKTLIKPETLKLFTTKNSAKSSRALGWDTATPESKNSSCGSMFAKTAFGHTGFTGTSVWCDLERNLCVVFLTNRVYPTSENIKIRAVRPVLHDAVVHSLVQ